MSDQVDAGSLEGPQLSFRQRSTFMDNLQNLALPRTVFVLDDEINIIELVCDMLNLIGVTARPFSNPNQFLSQVKLSEPELVILDLALGQTDAVEIIRKLEVLKFKGRVLLISGRDKVTLTRVPGKVHEINRLETTNAGTGK